jgi:hypothetical protein
MRGPSNDGIVCVGMRNALVALSVLAFVALLGVAGFVLIKPSSNAGGDMFGWPWAPYTPSVGHYTVTFPVTPKETWTSDASPPVSHIARATLVTDFGPNHEYEVQLTQLPRVSHVEKELDVGIDSEASENELKVLSRSKITLNGKYPGRAATLKDSKSKTLVRAYIVDDRRYVLICRGVENDADAARFLDSFTLVK